MIGFYSRNTMHFDRDMLGESDNQSLMVNEVPISRKEESSDDNQLIV